jgi:nucleoside-diphosphate-sugar epimerase
MIKKVKSVIIGSGLIGDALAKKLRKLGHKVTVLHHNEKINIKDSDYIFYVAGYGNHYHQTDEYKTFKAIVLDYLHLLRNTLHIQYKGLFYFSTSSVTLPIQTNYSDSKYIGEILSKRFCNKYKKPIVVIRPASIWGKAEAEWRFIPTAIRHLGSDEKMPFTEGWHDWLWVEDFVDGLVLIMKNCYKFIDKSIPIGSGKQISNTEVIRTLEKIAGKKINLIESETVKRPYDNKNWVSDITILKSLGWKPKTSLDKGLLSMVQSKHGKKKLSKL